ncbi:MAG: hypothetical protein ACFFDW_14335 [Candidatus Thorarchaeota archaeon]
MIQKKEVKICCTWKSKTECTNCTLVEVLNCRYDKRKWLFFVLNQIPARIFAFFGLVVTGLLYQWWPLIAFTVFAILYQIFGIEMRVVCTHCPYYSSENKRLRCYGLSGSFKIWKYRPGPMNFWEKAVEALHFFIMLLWPISFEVYNLVLVAVDYSSFDLYALLGMIAILLATILTGLQSVYVLIHDYCSKCANFSCSLNRVPKNIRDAYLVKNPIMREAWEKDGYKLN